MLCNAVDMIFKAWKKELNTQASRFENYKHCKKLKIDTGLGLRNFKRCRKQFKHAPKTVVAMISYELQIEHAIHGWKAYMMQKKL